MVMAYNVTSRASLTVDAAKSADVMHEVNANIVSIVGRMDET
jgi:hypothetical protein